MGRRVSGTWRPLWIEVWRFVATETNYCAMEVDCMVGKKGPVDERDVASSEIVCALPILWLSQVVCSVTLIWIVAAFWSGPRPSCSAQIVIGCYRGYASQAAVAQW